VTLSWVHQEESWGCGCAAVAMITGLSYQEIKAYAERDFDRQGMSSGDWHVILAELGYALSIIHRVRQYPWMNCARDEWPPRPWADVHLCEVVVAGGSGGSHMVVMLADGSVLDPLTPERKRLTDYAEVFQVAAVVPAPPIPQALCRVHRRPEREFARA
jgi:hypothetical protein